MELNICHLYPDVLNLYGDRGNIACMKKRLEWRGIGCAVTELPLGTADDLTGYDLFFIGGGQDFEQTVLLADLRAGRAENIRAAAEDGKTLLCICGGYQLLGNGYRTAAGQWCDYTGILDFTTEGSYERLIGNYAYRLGEESGGGTAGRQGQHDFPYHKYQSAVQKRVRHLQPRSAPAEEPGALR